MQHGIGGAVGIVGRIVVVCTGKHIQRMKAGKLINSFIPFAASIFCADRLNAGSGQIKRTHGSNQEKRFMELSSSSLRKAFNRTAGLFYAAGIQHLVVDTVPFNFFSSKRTEITTNDNIGNPFFSVGNDQFARIFHETFNDNGCKDTRIFSRDFNW